MSDFRKGLKAAKKGHKVAVHLNKLLNNGKSGQDEQVLEDTERALELLETTEKVLYTEEKEEDALINDLRNLIKRVNQEGLNPSLVKECISISEKAVKRINQETELEITAAKVYSELEQEITSSEAAKVEKQDEKRLEKEMQHTEDEVEELMKELSTLASAIRNSEYSTQQLVSELREMREDLEHMHQKISEAYSKLHN